MTNKIIKAGQSNGETWRKFFGIFAMTCIVSLFLITCEDYEDYEKQMSLDSDLVQPQNLVSVDNFRIGLQLADKGTQLQGQVRITTNWASAGKASTQWACDENCYQPDSIKVYLQRGTIDAIKGKDFKICAQAADTGLVNFGQETCTPWASEVGTIMETGYVTDHNYYQPGAYKLSIKTKNWVGNDNKKLDFAIGVEACDSGTKCGVTQWTPFLSQGGGWSLYALDTNRWAPNGIKIYVTFNE
jgi:hypothetical protein